MNYKSLIIIMQILLICFRVNAQSINDSFIIDYTNYSLEFTITSLSPNEVSVKCSTAPTVNTELVIPNVATQDGISYNVTAIPDSAFKDALFVGDLIIPSNVRTIGKAAFRYLKITSVTMPDNITRLNDKAFYNCDALVKVLLPKNLESIGQSTFYNCKKLETIELPASLETISYRAFSNCIGLKYISFHEGLKNIKKEAFNKCSSLIKVRSNSTTIPAIHTTKDEESFKACNSTFKIFVPADSIDAYKASWFPYEDQIYAMPSFVNDGEYSDESNWKALPTGGLAEAQDVLIEAKAVIKSDEIIRVESFGITSNGSITIEEGGQIIHQMGSGDVKVSKSVTAYVIDDDGQHLKSGWYTLSSPFIRSSVSPLTVNNYELFRYDEPTYHWENVKNQENQFVELESGRGYIYANEQETTLKMNGVLNTGKVYQTLTTSGELLNGFNLIGNPYMHNVSKGENSAIYHKNLTSGYYTLTNEGAWNTKLDGDIIAPMQGILVKTTKAFTLTINQIANTATRSSSEAYIKISVENKKYKDEACVIFNSGNGLDKINHRNGDIPMVYIRQNHFDYAIAIMDNDDIDEIPVCFEAKTFGRYTISVTTNDFHYDKLILTDNHNGNSVNIMEEDYTFMAEVGDNPERFTLKVIRDKEEITIYTNTDGIVISNLSANSVVNVYDVMGRTVTRRNADYDCTVPTKTMSKGIYIVNVTDEKESKTQKVVVK